MCRRRRPPLAAAGRDQERASRGHRRRRAARLGLSIGALDAEGLRPAVTNLPNSRPRLNRVTSPSERDVKKTLHEAGARGTRS
jgi:hypothetical protein